MGTLRLELLLPELVFKVIDLLSCCSEFFTFIVDLASKLQDLFVKASLVGNFLVLEVFDDV